MTESERIAQQLLVLRCQRRADADAWRALIEMWQPRLFYYIRRLVPQESDAWDVLQQTWVAAYTGIRSLAEPKHLATWLYRIARNKAVSHARVRVPEPADVVEDQAPADEDEQTTFDNAEAVHFALDRLSLPHREVLTLHFLQDLSIEQIALVLDVPAGTVKSRLFHARHKLKQLLAAQEEAR